LIATLQKECDRVLMLPLPLFFRSLRECGEVEQVRGKFMLLTSWHIFLIALPLPIDSLRNLFWHNK
jgi:hypothetical protein